MIDVAKRWTTIVGELYQRRRRSGVFDGEGDKRKEVECRPDKAKVQRKVEEKTIKATDKGTRKELNRYGIMSQTGEGRPQEGGGWWLPVEM
jgi:hypothetical protein